MTIKHTPGPWKVLNQDLPDMRVVVTCDMPPRLVTTAAFAEDARLIAAAPRLAEVLKQLLDYTLACELIVYDVEEQHNEHPVVAAARAALREAGVES